MADCRLTPAARDDLLGIAKHTLETWGQIQADRYAALLAKCFGEIADGRALPRRFLEHRPELQVCRCEHHYIFVRVEKGALPLILAVFHEKIDMMVRLGERLQ